MDYAEISCEVRLLPGGRREMTYRWQGDPRAPIRIGEWDVADAGGDPSARTLNCFPWPLRRVSDSEDFLRLSITYLRTDTANRLLWPLFALRAGGRQWWRHVEMRLIATLWMWGLAEVPNGHRFQWSHVRAVAWVRRLLARTHC